MSAASSESSSSRARGPQPWGATVWPTSPSGWVAIAVAAVGLGSWVVLPIVTSVFGERYPVTDTFVMPVIGLALTAIAAVVNVLAVWRGGQRSGVSVVAATLTVAATLFFGFFVIGEGLGGA
jgi:hypothetical protein